MALPIKSIVLQGPTQIVAYRNIATCDPSQDIFDDIADSKDWSLLQHADNRSSGIDHNVPQRLRPIQYGKIDDSLVCFDELFWRLGRFGDGSFGVWYGALEEETSIAETLFHRPEIDKNDLKNANGPIIQDRRLFEAQLSPKRFGDLRPHTKNFPLLTHETDYSFCQQMGRYAVDEGIDLYLSYSVRKAGGTCVPVFDPVIISDRPIRSYLNIFPLDGSLPFTANYERLSR